MEEFDECDKDLETCEQIRDECLMNVYPDDLSKYQWEWLRPSDYQRPGMGEESDGEPEEPQPEFARYATNDFKYDI